MKELTLLWGFLLAPILYATHHEAPYRAAEVMITAEGYNGVGFTYEAPQTLSGLPFDDVAVLAHVLYLEGRGEKDKEAALRAIGEVIINRVNSDRFPDTLVGVIWEPSKDPARPLACAFSALCDPSLDLRMLDVQASALSFKVAERLLTGYYSGYQLTMGADHYIRCDWNKKVAWPSKMLHTTTINNHCYYLEGKRT